MIRSSVDLPEPLGPSRAVSEPPSTSSETSSRAPEVAEPLGDVARPRSTSRSFLLRAEQRHRDEHDDGRSTASTSEIAVRAWQVEVLVGVLDAERRRLGLALEMPGDDRDRAVLAEAARGRQHDAVDHRPADRRERDAPERLPARSRRACAPPAPARRRARAASARPRARRTGSETKIVASTIDGSAKSTWMPWRSSQPPNQPVRP